MAQEKPKEQEVSAAVSDVPNESNIVVWPTAASQPVSEQDSSIGEDVKERHAMYIPSSQALESDSEVKNGKPSVLFEKLSTVSRPPRPAFSSDQGWKTLTSVPSRNGQDSMPERTGHGRRASVLSMKTDAGMNKPRRLSYSSYNDDPNTDNSDVVIGQGTTDLETGARVPHDVKDTTSFEDKGGHNHRRMGWRRQRTWFDMVAHISCIRGNSCWCVIDCVNNDVVVAIQLDA